MEVTQISLWVESLNPKPKHHTVPGKAMVINNHRPGKNRPKERAEKPATACQHHWVIDTPDGPECGAFCKKCKETKTFPTTLEDCNTSFTVRADRGGRW